MYQMTVRRKLAIATWSAPREGNIYGKLTLDCTEVLRFLEAVRERTGEKVTITHFVGRAVASALAKSPGLNGRILFNKYVQHERVSLAFLVALEEGQDLAKAKIDDLDKKKVSELAAELRELAGRLHKGVDDDFNKSKATIKMLPGFVLRPLLWLTGWLASSAGLKIKALGVEPFPFGAAIVTSVGMFGLDEGYVPPTPFARVPLYVLIGAIKDAPAVEGGQLVVRKQLTITATLDHRFVDGFQGGILAREMRRLFDNPWELEGMERPEPARDEVVASA